MNVSFEYGTTSVKDLSVTTPWIAPGKAMCVKCFSGRTAAAEQPLLEQSPLPFGFTSNIFRYFSHEEVFNRISEVAPNDRIRWCIERDSDGDGMLLAVTNPNAAFIEHDELRVCSTVTKARTSVCQRRREQPALAGLDATFDVAGDGFQNRFILDTPIDGFGKPSVYLSLMRLICSNGAVAYSPTFRSELSVGKGGDGVAFALTRVLDGFNNEDGFAALLSGLSPRPRVGRRSRKRTACTNCSCAPQSGAKSRAEPPSP